MNPSDTATSVDPTDSVAAWLRLGIALLISTIGGVGMWSVVVALPAIQAEFGVDRAAASLPYTFAMIGFAGGGVLMGRLADRFGIATPLALGSVALVLGYLGVGYSANLTQVALAHGLLIGFGCSATFGPLMADISYWFARRRGIAVAIAAAGNYLAGVVWPPLVQHFIAANGWRATHIGIGLFLLVSMLPLVLLLRRRRNRSAPCCWSKTMPMWPRSAQVCCASSDTACAAWRTRMPPWRRCGSTPMSTWCSPTS